MRTIANLALLALAASAFPSAAENWPAWRGPQYNGISTETNLPVEWSRTKNVLWKVKLHGAGVSSPVVWGDRLYITASDGRKNDRLHVTAYRTSDGKQLWHVQLFGTAPTNLYAPGGMAVPTPVTDGKHLYCLFGTGDLVCLDRDGQPRWIRSLAQEYGPFRNRWGMASSPILVGDLLVIQVDHWGESYLLGVDADTGRNRWKRKRDAHVNWTSPVSWPSAGGGTIVAIGTGRIDGYRPSDGKRLWSIDGINDQCVPSPLCYASRLFVGSAEDCRALALDKAGKPLEVWRNRRTKAYVSTPLCYRGCMYISGKGGVMTCLDVATGKQLWKERLEGECQATPVGADGKVYVATKQGTVYVLRAGKEFEPLARNEMGELIVATPAVAARRIYIRGDKHLYCIGSPTR